MEVVEDDLTKECENDNDDQRGGGTLPCQADLLFLLTPCNQGEKNWESGKWVQNHEECDEGLDSEGQRRHCGEAIHGRILSRGRCVKARISIEPISRSWFVSSGISQTSLFLSVHDEDVMLQTEVIWYLLGACGVASFS